MYAAMYVAAVSMLCTVFVLSVHHRPAKPMPRSLRVLAFRVVARLLCMRSDVINGNNAARIQPEAELEDTKDVSSEYPHCSSSASVEPKLDGKTEELTFVRQEWTDNMVRHCKYRPKDAEDDDGYME